MSKPGPSIQMPISVSDVISRIRERRLLLPAALERLRASQEQHLDRQAHIEHELKVGWGVEPGVVPVE